VVEAIRKIEHDLSFVPERGAVFRGRNMDTNIVINFLLICDVLKEILRAFVRGLYSVLHCTLNNVLSMQWLPAAFCIHLLERNRLRQLHVHIYGLCIIARIPLQQPYLIHSSCLRIHFCNVRHISRNISEQWNHTGRTLQAF